MSSVLRLGVIVTLITCWSATRTVWGEDATPREAAVTSATWELIFTWDGHPPGHAFITFNSDGTFVTSDGGHGRFFQKGINAVWAFQGVGGTVPDWSVVYSSTFSNGAFRGIQGWSHTSGKPIGVHTMRRYSQFVPDAKELAALAAKSLKATSAGVPAESNGK